MRPALIAFALALPTAALAQPRDLNVSDIPGPGAETVTAEIWVDNWFTLWVNGEQVLEDSTPYKTERSFNAERVTFRADRPMTIAFELRDFMENDTGLEYIGTGKQQLGDGGAIFQFRDASGALLTVSNADWRCHVAHHAPMDKSCARETSPTEGQGACASQTDLPTDWQAPGFDDSHWSAATEHSEQAVRPKDGYDKIRWDSSARLIWSPNLEQDNIVLCRATVE